MMRMDFFFFLICCSVDFLQQILPQENSSGRRLSILVSTSNKKVVQSLNYLLKLFAVLLPPAVASLPVLTLHCLLQQPEPTPEPQRDERDMGELSSPLCRATEGTGMAPVPQHSPPGQPGLQEELQEHRSQLFPCSGTAHFITAHCCC